MENEISIPKLILIDKPKGITSFDVIRILRKQLDIKKMGHAGTLDPLATGLLLVGVGSGTKKLHNLVGLPKTYYVEILLGRKTTTGDMEGDIVEEKEVGELKEEILRSVLQKLIGTLKLPVPVYSAVKRGGVPLYKKARQGEKVIAPVREMKVFDVRLIQHEKDEKGYIVAVEMDVASGVYVRSVAEEFGRILDVPATVKELRRTKIGDFDVKDAKQLEYDKKVIKKRIFNN
ncbi:MAG: tRNA pseudouridine(55) synthase TruB [Candidatus Pacebacteria bacterium]|nr:tRNA pseudouridine(55) synthase TruB [Candidatus Paceibacterota bacterium]